MERPRHIEKGYASQIRENKHTKRLECIREDGRKCRRC
jgi:hypothetical protein